MALVSVNSRAYMESRLNEMKSLHEVNVARPEKGLAFQGLPFRCRRRAASHYLNRVPRRIRMMHQVPPLKKKKPDKKKEGKRRLGRNAKNGTKWLSTHRWHAKRFHMAKTRDGWMLPQRSTQKDIKRAINSDSILFDSSFFSLVQVDGKDEEVAEKLAGSIFARTAEVGSKEDFLRMELNAETTVWLFSGSYPSGLVGRVTISWSGSTSESRCLRIWCHPSLTSSCMACFPKAIELTDDDTKPARFTLIGPKCLQIVHDWREKYSLTVQRYEDLPVGAGCQLYAAQRQAHELWCQISRVKGVVVTGQFERDLVLFENGIVPDNVRNVGGIGYENCTMPSFDASSYIVREKTELDSWKRKEKRDPTSKAFVVVKVQELKKGKIDVTAAIQTDRPRPDAESNVIGKVLASNYMRRCGGIVGYGLIYAHAIPADSKVVLVSENRVSEALIEPIVP